LKPNGHPSNHTEQNKRKNYKTKFSGHCKNQENQRKLTNYKKTKIFYRMQKQKVFEAIG
jgi:hypothetical protein